MKLALIPPLFLSLSLPVAAQYQWDFTQSPLAADPNHWTQNGGVTFGSPTTFSGSGGGSLIYNQTVSGTYANDYDLDTTLALKSGGGAYIEYIRAAQNTQVSSSGSQETCSGSYYFIEIDVPATFNPAGTLAPLTLYQCYSGTLTQAASAQINVHDGMTMRLVAWNRSFAMGTLYVFADNIQVLTATIRYPATGNPGLGGYNQPAGSGFTSASVGHHDLIAPGNVNAQTIASSILPTQICFQWAGVVDDANGIGLFRYDIYRRDSLSGNTYLAGRSATPEWCDDSLQSGVTYNYYFRSEDYHGNYNSPGAIIQNINPPPAQMVDPRRTGVHPLGSYWGAAGEQIDMSSGNLNYTVSLVTAQGRGSWSVPFNLTYNSQNWRQDNATWKLGYDVGYGFGWQLLAGSIAPYYTSLYGGVDHYLFTDATGAQYRLATNTNGIWSSTESIYIWFDANAGVLHFRDGSFWTMGSISGGTEADAGTMYPTQMEDANGNLVIISYQAGASTGYTTNTSARISAIEDVRGKGSATYAFTYNTDTTPHLTGITNNIGTPENFSFFTAPYLLYSPFSPSGLYGSTAVLQEITNNAVGTTRSFLYDASQGAMAGSGELIEATMPDGGNLEWTYTPFTYNVARTYREVQNRYLMMSAGATPLQYQISHNDTGNNQPTVHQNTTVQDASGAQKEWLFYTQNWPGPGTWAMGLVRTFQNHYLNGSVGARDVNYFWTTDPAGNPYITEVDTILDDQTPNSAHMEQTQTLDQYGNVTTASTYDYNNLNTPLVTYTNTWRHSQNSTYDAAYLRNLLVSSSVTDNNGHNATLVTNTYDGGTLSAINGTPAEWDASNGGRTVRGNLTQSVSPGQTTNFTYDVTGHQVSGANSSGTGATVTYSSATNWAVPDALTPAAGTGDVQNGHTVTQAPGSTLQNGYGYNSALSLVSTTMPNSATTAQNFNSSTGLLTSSTSVYGATTSYTYTFNPTLVTATTNSHWAKSYRDGFGREIANESGYGSTIVSHTDMVYGPCACSPLGKVTQVSQPYGINGSTKITSDGTGTVAWTTYAYDSLGRTTSITAADGSVTNYSYAGNTVTATDPAGHWKTYTVNALGQLVQVIEPKPSTDTTGNPANTYTTTYTYDIEGHLTGVTMPRPTSSSSTYTQTRTFTYDLATGHLTSAVNPESGTTNYTYYPDGRLQSKAYGSTVAVGYSYDGYGRLAFIDRYYQGQPDPCSSVSLIYDSTLTSNGVGRLTQASWGVPGSSDACAAPGNVWAVTESYGYNAAGQATSRTYWIDEPVSGAPSGNLGESFGTNWTYDNEGQNTGYSVSGPGAVGSFAMTYTMDQMDRPVAMNDSSSPAAVWVQNVSYGPSSEPRSIQMLTASGAYYTENRTYNNRLQLLNLTASAQGLPGLNLTYSYNTGNNGQAAGVSDAISGEQIVYHYDELNRLKDAETTQGSGTQWGQAFTYDGFGNLLTKGSYNNLPATTMNLTVNPANNQMVLSGYGYGANGVLGSINYQFLLWDQDNRTGSSNGGYDLENELLFNSAAAEWTIYGAGGQRLAGYQISFYTDGTNWYCDCVQTWRNIWFGGRLIQSKGQTVLTDRTGSVRANESGQRFEYFPYGEEITVQNPQDREKFGTYTRTSFFGLDYAWNRWYDSVHGVFISPDPYDGSMKTTNPMTMNRYAYTQGDPINLGDPAGLIACGQLLGWQGNQDLQDLIEGSSEAALFGRVIWAESSHDPTTGGYFEQKEGIGWSILDRYAILHGQYSVQSPDGSPLNPATLGFVPLSVLNPSYADVIGYGGFQSVVGSGNASLKPAFQAMLNAILNGDIANTGKGFGPLVGIEDPVTHQIYGVNTECYNVIESYVAGNMAASGTLPNPLQSWGLVTSFNTNGSSAGPNLEQFTSFGNTTFYGFRTARFHPSPATGGIIRPPISRGPGRPVPLPLP